MCRLATERSVPNQTSCWPCCFCFYPMQRDLFSSPEYHTFLSPFQHLRLLGCQRLPLETVDISPTDVFPYVKNRWTSILKMCSPTLRTLNVNKPSSEIDDKLGFEGLIFPNLRVINVTRSRLKMPGLMSLIFCCTGLERFTYQAPPYHTIKPSAIIRYLNRHQETLIAVTIDLMQARNLLRSEAPTDALPSLKSFPSLREVSLNSLFIFNPLDEQPEDDKTLYDLSLRLLSL
ncbi:hypothetical protein F5Y16DRAFT_278729 [Xylariaceae sp. FL0255]|nr:hypothetical protein F5Y16DRAFT_278729 [Xylariaceae sp. FL0255]